MERLTGKNNDYCFTVCGGERKHIREECNIYNVCFERQIYERLKYYEDLAEAGQLVVLPCKVGDTVWVYYSMQNEIEEKTIQEIVIGRKHDTLIFTDSMQFTVWDKSWEYAFQNFIFHTREEAEAALKGGDSDA